MPTYDYECTKCSEPHQTQHSMSADKPDCPACGGSLMQVFLTAPAIGGTSSGSSANFGSCDAPAGACGTGACPFQ